MQSREIKQLIDQFDSKRRGAVAESIRHTVESTDALTRATLLVAYGQLKTAEAIEAQTAEISRLFGISAFDFLNQELSPLGTLNAPLSQSVSEGGVSELKDLSAERVSIPK